MTLRLVVLRDAELVAFGVEHHDVAEVLAVQLLTHACRSGGNELVRFCAEEWLARGHVPRRRSGHFEVNVHPVLGGLGFRNPGEVDSGQFPVRIDDRGTVRVVVPRLRYVPERLNPKGGKPMRVSRVVAERPSSRHSRTLSGYGNAIGIEILNGSGRACLAV